MQLSNGTLFGICWWFSFAAAQMYVLVSAEEAAGHLRPDRRAVLTMIGWSLILTIPVAAMIWVADWVLGWVSLRLDDHVPHGRVSVAALLAIAWALAALSNVAGSSAKRVKLATGVDVLRRESTRTTWISMALAMILGLICLVGGRLLGVESPI